jgi:putative hydrolase of the HAD superfamily
MIKCFIFDIGGVMIDYTNKEYYDYLSRISKIKRKDIDFIVDPLVAKLEIDAINIKQFNSQISKIFNLKKKQVGWIEFYKKHVKIKRGTFEVINKLHKHYKIGFFSNVDISRYKVTVDHIFDSSIFDYKFASCFIKIRKPDKESYYYISWKIKIRPEDICFIDDRKENLYTARMIGMKTVLFSNPKKLKLDLSKYLK